MKFSKLWRVYVPDDDDDDEDKNDAVDVAKIDLPEEDFPLTYIPRHQSAGDR
jgi:hypothetical protein